MSKSLKLVVSSLTLLGTSNSGVADMQQLIRILEYHKQELEMAALKLTPPVAMTTYVVQSPQPAPVLFTIMGHPLSEWLIISTLIYTWLQICLLLRKMWLERQTAVVCKRDDDPPKE